MKTINEILNELKEHPDFVHVELWTKDDVVAILENDGELDGITKEFITEEEWHGLAEDMWIYYQNCLDNLGPPVDSNNDFEDMKLRLKREGKLNHILKEDLLDKVLFDKK